MATEIVGKVSLDGSSIGNIRQQLKEATRELIAMQEQFGTTSDQAIAAAQKVAGLKDQIQDAREVADLFDPGKKFAAFSGVISGVAQGFTAVQGAMGLFGVESKELEKQLLRVQSAMALSQGLSGVLDAAGKFKDFANVIKKDVVGAFKTLKGAIAATGLGLLVVALGTIVAYWEDIVGLMDGVSSEQKKLNELAAENTKKQQDKLTALEKSDETLKASGKSESQILKLKMEQTKQVIEAIKLEIKRAEFTRDAQIEAAKRNRDILVGVLEFLTKPTRLLLSVIDDIGAKLGQNFGLVAAMDKTNATIANFIFDPEAARKEGQATVDQLKSDLTDAENKFAGYQNKLTDIGKKGASDRAEQAKKEQDEQKKRDEARFAERQKAEQDLAALRDKYRKEEEDAAAKTEAQKLTLEKNRRLQEVAELNGTAADKLMVERWYQSELAKLRDKEQKTSLQNVIAGGNATTQKLAAQAQENLRIAKEEFEQKQAIRQAEMKLYADVGSTLSALSDVIGKETAAGKALSIAQATINTWLGVTEVLKQKSVLPEPAATISKIVNAAAIVASGLNAVRNIVRTRVPGGGGGGGGAVTGGGLQRAAPLSGQLSPQAQLQVQNQQAINNMGNQAMRAYVLNSDLQNNQQINAYLLRNASIG